MLRITGLARSFAGRPVLRCVNLVLAPGEYVAVIGESGVGKSTLLNVVAGLERADAGRVDLDGQDLCTLADDAATLVRRRHIGFVFQAFHVLAHLTVEQNVALPLLLAGVPARERSTRARAMLEAVGLAARAPSWPRELSGGELQRVAIARALVHAPRLVLADEPTGNLDPASAAAVAALLRAGVKAHAGMGLVVTHSAAVAASADRVLVLTGDGLVAA